MNRELVDLYSDYLLSSFGATTATGLSELLEGTLSHDQITRFLSQQRFDSKTLWQLVKPMIRAIEDDAGVLIFDDTIQEKPYTDENELISWHFDHSKNRTVKGINLLNCVYHAQGVTLPVAYELITKPIVYRDEKTSRLKRKSTCSKNEHPRLHLRGQALRRMLTICQRNRVAYRYVLADSWFSAKENLHFIRSDLGKHFVIALKSNRTVALSYDAKRQGVFSRLDALNLPEHQAVRGYLRGLDFPVLLVRQVFTNKDGSTGVLYLACSDLDGDAGDIIAIYQKRWNVETFHKTLKSHASLAKSPTRTVRTQSNHCFLAIYAACRLTWLSVIHGLGHVALRTRLYLKAVRHAFDELQLLKTA